MMTEMDSCPNVAWEAGCVQRELLLPGCGDKACACVIVTLGNHTWQHDLVVTEDSPKNELVDR